MLIYDARKEFVLMGDRKQPKAFKSIPFLRLMISMLEKRTSLSLLVNLRAFECVRRRSSAFDSVRLAAFTGVRRSRGVREAFARRSRGVREGVREAFARRSRSVRDAFATRLGCALERQAFGSVRRRSEAFKGVRERLACQRFLRAWAGYRMTR